MVADLVDAVLHPPLEKVDLVAGADVVPDFEGSMEGDVGRV